MAPHGREITQEKKIIYLQLHHKGEGYKKIGKALLINQVLEQKWYKYFKKGGSATISQRRLRSLGAVMENHGSHDVVVFADVVIFATH